MLFQCEGKGIAGFLCILIRTDGITIVLIHIVANQCNFLYDAEVACFDGVAAIGVSIHIVEDGGNPLWLLCIIGGVRRSAMASRGFCSKGERISPSVSVRV